MLLLAALLADHADACRRIIRPQRPTGSLHILSRPPRRRATHFRPAARG